ncbi:MAG: aldehyde ferredoxin oxidoreductase family protein [Hydrogenothermaceae bacterium]|nr:aldehyde ferredoxin oxidoreductase family protein [Hydrogenothermaceae bacterium]
MSYTGKILTINLTDRSYTKDSIDEDVYKKFLGGSGISVKLLYELLNPKTNPFSEENVIIFGTGPANGTLIPIASKFSVVSKSPLTNTVMKSFCGGRFGNFLKYAGFDFLIIKGKSAEPVYLLIEDENITVRNAEDIVYEGAIKTQEIIKERHGNDFEVVSVGPAGINKVRYACLISEQRAAGTGGLGAVFGSKNLKAIAVKGSSLIKIKNEKRFFDFIENFQKNIYKHPASKVLKTYGTAAGLMNLQYLGALPTKNWIQESFDGAENISGENIIANFTLKNIACFNCPIPCGHYNILKNEKFKGIKSVGPEYEGQFSLGSIVGIDDPEILLYADYLTDELGLGQVHAGTTIAWAMEAFEKGIITEKDTDGLKLNFGNKFGFIELLKKIAYREGIGDILAEGSEVASRYFKGGDEFLMTVKGMEIHGHSPRVVKTQAIGYAVSNRGPTHCEVRPGMEETGIIDSNIEGKGRIAKELSDWTAVCNSIIYCLSAEKLVGLKITDQVVDMINAITDFDIDIKDVIKIGERINTVERMFNYREGFTAKDDKLPKRITSESIKSGISKGKITTEDDLETMKQECYLARGWDRNGVPTLKTLERLDLDFCIKDLNF